MGEVTWGRVWGAGGCCRGRKRARRAATVVEGGLGERRRRGKGQWVFVSVNLYATLKNITLKKIVYYFKKH